MSSNISEITESNKIEILYKKSLGVPTTKPNATVAQEPSTSALPTIIPSLQIFSEKIPTTAPTTDLILDDSFSQDGNSLAKRYYSIDASYIVKYENIQLTEVQYRQSYKGTASLKGVSTNLLSKTIPFNYDPDLTYDITVKLYNDATSTSTTIFPSSSDVMPWNYDKDAGFITFYGSVTNKNTYLQQAPLMTFWRYEGTFGISSSSGSSSGSTSTGTGAFTYLSSTNQILAPGGITGTIGSFTTISSSAGISGPTGSFTFLSASQQISAPGGITGATGSFTHLSASQQISAPAGITGATGSFTNLSASQQILAPAGITGATGSFTFLSASQQILAPAGITGASGSFTFLNASQQISAPAGITGASASFTTISSTAGITGPTGSFTHLSASQIILAPAGITGATGSFTFLSASQQISAPAGIT